MPIQQPGIRMQIPLVVLAVLSVGAGFIELPPTMGHLTLFSDFLHTALPPLQAAHASWFVELLFQLIAAAVSLGGIYIVWQLIMGPAEYMERLTRLTLAPQIAELWYSGWGFDRAYDLVFVRPYVWLAEVNRNDFIDLFYRVLGVMAELFHFLLSLTQTGVVRRYAMGIAIGAAVTVGLVILL